MRRRSIEHHPRSETLALYAAGGMDEARAVVLATHLTLCDQCKTAVSDFEALGGMVLETMEPVAMSDNALAQFWHRAGDDSNAVLPISTRPANDFDFGVAQPLRRYIKGGLDKVDWKMAAPGLAQHIIEADGYRPGVLRLLKIMPGTRMPKHSHQDGEFTLILRGAYEDELGTFRPGDFADLDDDHTHSPMAIGDEPCICLIATNAPLKMKSMVGRVVQPFIGL